MERKGKEGRGGEASQEWLRTGSIYIGFGGVGASPAQPQTQFGEILASSLFSPAAVSSPVKQAS